MAKKRIWQLLTVVLAIVLCAALLCACKGDKGDKGDKGLQGEQGIQGERGPAGSDGADGDMWYVGNGDPSNNALADTKSGDMYLDSDSGDVYQKQPDGSWQLKANIKGLTGETGIQGPQGEQGDEGLQGEQGVQGERGPAGSDGADGDMWYVDSGDPSNNALADTKSGDMYLDSDSGDVYQKQPDGSWQLKANIKGLTGETGIQGPQGEQGDKGDKGDDAPHANEILTVTFDAQGGELPQEFPQEQRVNYGDVLQLPVPTRDNYTFVGWYTGDSVNDGKFTTVTPVTKDITLFARWQVKTKYRVTFDTCDGDPMDAIDYFADEQIANLPEPTRADYDFVGWYSDEHFVNAVQYPLTLSGNIVVYAQWKKASYTVTFHVNQGSTPSPVTAEAGTSLSSFEAAQVSDYVFDGWYYNQEYTSRVEFPLELHSDLDIYGKWTADPFAGYTRVQDFMQLQNITDMSGKYVLTDDIDCLGLQISMFAPDGNPFKGVFDGAGHKIFNFTLYVPSGMKIGFFGVNAGTIKNLRLDYTLTVAGAWGDGDGLMCGALVGYNKGQIENVLLKLTIDFNNSYYYGCETIVGGIAGRNEGTINNAQVVGTIKAVSSGAKQGYLSTHYVGGIVGENVGAVTNTLVSVAITSETTKGMSDDCKIGGIVGYNSGKIENSLFVGSASGTEGKSTLNAICVLGTKGSSVKCYKAYTITVEGGSPAIESALNSKSFYTDTLGWDEAIWNFDSLDFAQGQYPQLR